MSIFKKLEAKVLVEIHVEGEYCADSIVPNGFYCPYVDAGNHRCELFNVDLYPVEVDECKWQHERCPQCLEAFKDAEATLTEETK